MSDPVGGYTGRMLRVDLDKGAVSVEATPDVRKWLGPRGWNAWLTWNEVFPGVGPFDPENLLLFSVGPLGGTHAPTSGRMTVATIGPRGYPQPMWTTASIGGYFGAELKWAGYDGVIVRGAASAPCYLLIEDERATLEDASELWGTGVFTVQQALKARHSLQHQVLAIGPAGENRVRYASIGHRLTNAVGNGGFGGVMGAKGLKALVVRGTRGVPIARPAEFMQAVADVWRMAKGGISRLGQIESGMPRVACTHACSAKCGTYLRRVEDLYDSHAAYDMGTCVDGSWAHGLGRAYQGTRLGRDTLDLPGLERLGDAGAALGNLVEELGMTTWVYYTWGHYFAALKALGIEEILGERLEPESPDWWRDWLLRVAHREGTGDDYAEGLARFYDKHPVGPRHLAEFLESGGSRGHGWHREGRVMERHPSPFWEHGALLYAVSTRDMSPNTHGFYFHTFLGHAMGGEDGTEAMPEPVKDLARRLYGSEKAFLKGDSYIEHATVWHQYRSAIKDSMGVCDWVFPLMRRNFETEEEFRAAKDIYGDPGAEARLYRACTGVDLSIEAMERPIAERVVNLERCIDIRNHGRNRAVDELVIPHFQWPEKTDGTHLSESGDEFRALLDRFYALRGWDRKTGWPTAAKLAELGLEDVAQALYPRP